MSVLDEIVAEARRRASNVRPTDAVCDRANFADALRGRDRLSVIAEFKRESPSLGGIAPDRAVEPQVRRYADLGAAAISVLTEPTRFSGSDDDLVRAAATVDVPLLMKDFIVDPVQIGHGASLGASAVLLIVRCLDGAQLDELAAACRDHRVTPLVECHDAAEVERALRVEDAVIGVNNRDLSTLEIDLANAPRLLAEVPANRIAVAESGYIDEESIESIRGVVDAVLVGTALMRADDPGSFMRTVTR